MSLHVIDDTPGIPHTHVLIIGVGGYPYLQKMREQQNPESMSFSDLEELTSPVLSATAFFDAVKEINDYNAWVEPLGTITLLISTPAHVELNQKKYTATDPTRENLESAYAEWKARCNTHRDNVAVFYYCGHGFSKGNDFLLASDFMKNQLIPEAHAFNLQRTRRGFHTCKAERKLFLIDACRMTRAETLMTDYEPHGLDNASYIGELKYCFTQKSTGPGGSAFGLKSAVSNYTQALIRALKGQACEDDNRDRWIITTGDLGKKINAIMAPIIIKAIPQLADGEVDFDQFSDQSFMQDFTILSYPQPPKVIINVEINPGHLCAVTELTCQDLNTFSIVSHRRPAPEKWTFTVDAGIYAIEGRTIEEPILAGKRLVMARPPETNPLIHIK